LKHPALPQFFQHSDFLNHLQHPLRVGELSRTRKCRPPMTNNLRDTLSTTTTGAVTGSALVVSSEFVQGVAKAGSAVVGFLILVRDFGPRNRQAAPVRQSKGQALRRSFRTGRRPSVPLAPSWCWSGQPEGDHRQ